MSIFPLVWLTSICFFLCALGDKVDFLVSFQGKGKLHVLKCHWRQISIFQSRVRELILGRKWNNKVQNEYINSLDWIRNYVVTRKCFGNIRHFLLCSQLLHEWSTSPRSIVYIQFQPFRGRCMRWIRSFLSFVCFADKKPASIVKIQIVSTWFAFQPQLFLFLIHLITHMHICLFFVLF